MSEAVAREALVEVPSLDVAARRAVAYASRSGRQSPAWRLAAALRAYPALRDLDGSAAAARLREWTCILPGGAADLAACWELVRKPLAVAVAPADVAHLAGQWPLEGLSLSGGYQRAASVAWWLSLAVGGGVWWASCRSLAAACGAHHETAAAYLRRMVADGLIEVAEPAIRGRRRATVYRWVAPVRFEGGGVAGTEPPAGG